METDKAKLDHNCLHEYEFGQIQTSIANTERSITEIKQMQGEIFNKINGLPTKLKAHETSIGRLWKLIYVVAAGVVGATITALAR